MDASTLQERLNLLRLWIECLFDFVVKCFRLQRSWIEKNRRVGLDINPLTFCLWPATRKIPSSFAPRLTSSRKMLCRINGTSDVSSPVTCWSRRTSALSDTPKTLPSSLRFRLNGFRLSSAMWCLSKMVANSSHKTGCSFLMSPSGMLLMSLQTSSIVSHSDPSLDFSVSRIMLSKLIGASCAIRYGVLVLLALWKFIMSLVRGGELPGLGDDDVDEFDDVSLSM